MNRELTELVAEVVKKVAPAYRPPPAYLGRAEADVVSPAVGWADFGEAAIVPQRKRIPVVLKPIRYESPPIEWGNLFDQMIDDNAVGRDSPIFRIPGPPPSPPPSPTMLGNLFDPVTPPPAVRPREGMHHDMASGESSPVPVAVLDHRQYAVADNHEPVAQLFPVWRTISAQQAAQNINTQRAVDAQRNAPSRLVRWTSSVPAHRRGYEELPDDDARSGNIELTNVVVVPNTSYNIYTWEPSHIDQKEPKWYLFGQRDGLSHLDCETSTLTSVKDLLNSLTQEYSDTHSINFSIS